MRSPLAQVVLAVAFLAASAGAAFAQNTARVSVLPGGGEPDDDSVRPCLSADGRYVAFDSGATNLVAGDTNGSFDVFVVDRTTGETERVSVSSSGAQANGASERPAISADGRVVAFVSRASNLVAGDTNGGPDVFVHDRETHETVRASVGSSGEERIYGGGVEDVEIALSADGRLVAFACESGNLVPGDGNRASDVFVHDLWTGETSIVSVAGLGVPGNRGSYNPSISADGRFVAYESSATNLVAGDTNRARDVFVYDRRTGATERVSVRPDGGQVADHCSSACISADGSFVAFFAPLGLLPPLGTGYYSEILVSDRRSRELSRAGVDSDGAPARGTYDELSISPDGRVVAFLCGANDLVPGDTNGLWDVFTRDRGTGRTSRENVSTEGVEADGVSFGTALSGDGRFVAFASKAASLVPGDANGAYDVFVRDRNLCDAGNVNDGAGAVADVLFVNDSAGGPMRSVRLLLHEPLTVFMSAPPAALGAATFALYGWRIGGDVPTVRIALPFGIGDTCLPTPITGGSPAPRVVWNNTGWTRAGAPNRPSIPAPSIVVHLPRGLRRPTRAFLQGIIADPGAPNGRAAVTNGVRLEVD